MDKVVINKGSYTVPDNLEVVVKGNNLIVQRKESKDEKMLGRIIRLLCRDKDCEGRPTLTDELEWLQNKKGMLASLEEQKKQKKPVERSLKDNHIIGFVYDLLNEIEWKDNWAMSKEECLRQLNDYRPQKSAECNEDEKIRKEIVEFLTYGIWNATTIDKVKQSQKYAKWISYLEEKKEDYSSFPEEERKYMEKYIPLDRTTLIKLLAERDRETEEILKSFEGLDEEKPAEWSEEDEKHLNWVIEHFSQSGELYHDLIAWFKSLPERFNLQPKQEWSEKDEKMRKSIINILGDNTDAHEEGWAIFADEIAWLKSRHPSWKPTEKQMEALVRVVSYRKMSWGDRLILLGLVKDFKEFYNL